LRSGGFFDLPHKQQRFEELEAITSQSEFWNSSDSATEILKEKSELESILGEIHSLEAKISDSKTALELAEESEEIEFLQEAERNLSFVEAELDKLEFKRKMSGRFDAGNAIIEINSGSGGTEAQDWADMLLRMYLRWAERKGFKVEELDYQAGEEAGIKRVSILVSGSYVYGQLRSEQGVHRLVRISPFDSNARRHTSFASVAVTPEIDQEVDIEIEDKDIRIDTYRSSGAGGQHVNKTDSAIRISHIPSGIVVACQNERSQHKNKDMAFKILKAKLFEIQQEKQLAEMKQIQGERKQIDFGSQIRSYVLHPYKLVKDLRTEFESSSPEKVLDGDIDGFIESYLLSF